MKNVNCEYTGTHQIAWLIDCTSATFMVYFHHNNRDKRRRNDGRRASAILTISRLEPDQDEEKRQRVFLCQEMEAVRRLPRSGFKSGGNYRRACAGETSQGSLEKIKPPAWMATNFTAVRLLLMDWSPARSSHSYDLPTFSIAACPRTSQWLCDMWAYERRCAHE